MSESKNQLNADRQLWDLIERIPLGATDCQFNGRRYLVTKSIFNKGRSIKIYAEELGGNDFVSANFYLTASGVEFKPCEMSKDKVRQFLAEAELSQK